MEYPFIRQGFCLCCGRKSLMLVDNYNNTYKLSETNIPKLKILKDKKTFVALRCPICKKEFNIDWTPGYPYQVKDIQVYEKFINRSE